MAELVYRGCVLVTVQQLHEETKRTGKSADCQLNFIEGATTAFIPGTVLMRNDTCVTMTK